MIGPQAGQLLVARWSAGPGPEPQDLGDAQWYRAEPPLQGGLLLARNPGPALEAVHAETVALYAHWQGAEPGPGFLDGTAPISMFAADVEAGVAAAWDAYYRDEHFPAVLGLEGYAAGARFRLSRRLPQCGARTPEWLTLYQLDCEEALARLGDPDSTPADAAAVYADWQRRGAPLTTNVVMARFRPT